MRIPTACGIFLCKVIRALQKIYVFVSRRERDRTHHNDPETGKIQQHGEENVRIAYDPDP